MCVCAIDLELMAADETLQGGDDDSQSVMLVGDDTGAAETWRNDVEPSTSRLRPPARRNVADDDSVFGELVVCELRHVTGRHCQSTQTRCRAEPNAGPPRPAVPLASGVTKISSVDKTHKNWLPWQ